MNNFRSILAFGDSHVAGCELSESINSYGLAETSIEQADADGKLEAFPQLIANELEIPCHNYAMTGGTNDRSLRLLAKAVKEHPDSLVLFGYTYTDRREFYYPDEGNVLGRDKDGFVQAGAHWEPVKSLIDRSDPINKVFVKKILRSYNNLDQVMFYVDAACRLHAKQYVHLPFSEETFSIANHAFDFDGHGSYINWCRHKKFKKLKYGHYGKEAHRALAELILHKISSQ